MASVALQSVPIPADKAKVKTERGQEEYPVPVPAEMPLQQRRDPIGAPKAERHKNQPQYGIDFIFDASDALLNIIVHAWFLFRAGVTQTSTIWTWCSIACDSEWAAGAP
jgi:hypothetical protein